MTISSKAKEAYGPGIYPREALACALWKTFMRMIPMALPRIAPSGNGCWLSAVGWINGDTFI